MNVFANLFGAGGGQPAAPAQPKAQEGLNMAVPPQSGEPAPAPEPAAPVNPLDAFSKLWETTPADPNASQQPQGFLNMQKMAETMKGIDYVRNISPEVLQKAVSGDVAAFSDVMNNVARMAVMQGAVLSEKLGTGIVDRRLKEFDGTLDGRFKNLAVGDSLAGTNPQFSHPALKPMIDGLRAQFIGKFPTATSAEITQHINNYLSSIAPHFGGNTGGKQEPTPQEKPAVADFSTYFT